MKSNKRKERKDTKASFLRSKPPLVQWNVNSSIQETCSQANLGLQYKIVLSNC